MSRHPTVSVLRTYDPTNRTYPSPTLLPASGDELFRLGLLIVGIPRHPFSIQVTQRCRTLEQLPIAAFADLSNTISKKSYMHKHHRREVTIRFFRALKRQSRKDSTARRYLRVDDPDIVALIEMRDRSVKDAYVSVRNEIAVDQDLLDVLSSSPTPDWKPQDSLEEIHVLVVLDASTRNFNVPMDTGPKIPIFRSRAPPRPQLCYGGDMDRRLHLFHQHPHKLLMFQFCYLATDGDVWINEFPFFDHIQLKSKRCRRPLHWQLSEEIPQHLRTREEKARFRKTVAGFNKLKDKAWAGLKAPFSPPRLSVLAADVVFHSLLSGPPQYLDPVDCIIDASLLCGGTEVLANVLCFVKFQPNEEVASAPDQFGLSVNPSMLEVLNQVAEMGEPSRPRLLVIVSSHSSSLRIEEARLPAKMAKVVALTSRLVKPVDEPLRYVGNTVELDLCQDYQCHHRFEYEKEF